MDKTEYAFPLGKYVDEDGDVIYQHGLLLRDYFAAKAMAAQMANPFITERFGIMS